MLINLNGTIINLTNVIYCQPSGDDKTYFVCRDNERTVVNMPYGEVVSAIEP